VRLSPSNDTRLLLAGIGAFFALCAYLVVAFANTHASASTAPTWVANAAKLAHVSSRKGGESVVRVTPEEPGSYGAYIPTLVADPPPGSRFVVGLSLKGPGRGRVGVQVHLFRSGSPSRYLVDATVASRARWHHFTFRGRVRGSWTGLSVNVYRQAKAAVGSWFAIRGLTVYVR
jgi:hypothetical protein